MSSCIFCQIAKKISPAYIIWEDEQHVAFLSIYPNTPGVTVIITKEHYDSYALNLPDEILSNLVLASKKVARLLDEKLPDVGRTGLVLEGFGINHVHAKLYPLHGTKQVENWQPIKSDINTFQPLYQGYISSHDCNTMTQQELSEIHALFRRRQH